MDIFPMLTPFEVLRQRVDHDTLLAALKWVGGLSATAAAGFTVKFSRRIRSSFLNKFWNLTCEDARNEARRYIGPHVANAIPFRVLGSDDQYIAVLQSTPPSDEVTTEFRGELSLLRGAKGCYELIKTDLTQLLYGPRHDYHFGVADISGNGGRDIFVVSYSAGSGASSVDVDLYDTETCERYKITWFETHHVVPPEISYSGDFSRKPGARQWLRNHATKVAALYEVPLRNRHDRAFRRAEEEWVARHGNGFVQGRIQPTRYHGQIPRIGEAHCTVDDGDYQWASFFKGPVVGYQKAVNRYFILFVPPSEYHWVSNVIVGKRYLWFQMHTSIDNPRGIVVVRRGTWQMQVLPIALPKQVPSWDADLFLSGSLAVQGGQLFLNGFLVDLPDSINPDEEFQNVRAAVP